MLLAVSVSLIWSAHFAEWGHSQRRMGPVAPSFLGCLHFLLFILWWVHSFIPFFRVCVEHLLCVRLCAHSAAVKMDGHGLCSSDAHSIVGIVDVKTSGYKYDHCLSKKGGVQKTVGASAGETKRSSHSSFGWLLQNILD